MKVSLVCSVMWMASALCQAAAPNGRPVGAGPLTPADVKVDGMKVTLVPANQTFEIEPLAIEKMEFDAALKAGTPSHSGPVSLPKGAWIFRALAPGSLVVAPEGQPDVKLVLGKDYLLDADWAGLGAPADSPYVGKNIHCAYTWSMSRMDLVERTADGKLVLRKGKPDREEPLLPEFTPGATPLFGVYLAPNATKLAPENIKLIDLKAGLEPQGFGAEYLRPLKDKLAAGKGVTIVFLGDSITAQGPKDFRDGKGSFVVRFTAYMQAKYPGSKVVATAMDKVVPAADKQIVIVMAGVGGNNSTQGLARLDKDVLAQKPDAVVVMFGVNDENREGNKNNVPVPAYKKNLEAIVEKVRAAGGDVILMTTSMKCLGWAHTMGNLNEYAAAAREVAKDKKLCLIDNFKSWELIPKCGYDYMVYLDNSINHPNDLGHELFIRNLKAAFERP